MLFPGMLLLTVGKYFYCMFPDHYGVGRNRVIICVYVSVHAYRAFPARDKNYVMQTLAHVSAILVHMLSVFS